MRKSRMSPFFFPGDLLEGGGGFARMARKGAVKLALTR